MGGDLKSFISSGIYYEKDFDLAGSASGGATREGGHGPKWSEGVFTVLLRLYRAPESC